jgi:hypothetical protein
MVVGSVGRDAEARDPPEEPVVEAEVVVEAEEEERSSTLRLTEQYLRSFQFSDFFVVFFSITWNFAAALEPYYGSLCLIEA